MVQQNLDRVLERIAGAAKSAGRDPSQVRLICVTKGISPEKIQEAIACGVTEIGENRVQEAQAKQEVLNRYQVLNGLSVPGTSLRWHLIGHLQRNKAKLAAELFDCIHSVDTPETVEALERAATLRQISVRPSTGSGRTDSRLEVLVQVNVSGEETKGGCRLEEVKALAEEISRAKNLALGGLMTMAPFSKNPEDARPVFAGLTRLRDELQRDFPQAPLGLSMGMSGDFEVAVQEGATMVRVGSAIFNDGSVMR